MRLTPDLTLVPRRGEYDKMFAWPSRDAAHCSSLHSVHSCEHNGPPACILLFTLVITMPPLQAPTIARRHGGLHKFVYSLTLGPVTLAAYVTHIWLLHKRRELFLHNASRFWTNNLLW